jgi:hypothetical protein
MTTRRADCLSITDFLRRYDSTLQDVIKAADGGTEPGPALCRHGCNVHLRETCSHGCPSVLLTLMTYDYQCGDPLE